MMSLFSTVYLAAAALLLTTHACFAQPSESPRMNSSPAFPQKFQQYLTNKRTVCFGRFLIDVPSDAKIVFGRQTVDGELDYVAEGARHMDELIRKQHAEIEKERMLVDPKELPKYGHVVNGAVPGQRIVYGYGHPFYKLTAYIPKPPHLFILVSGATETNEQIEIENINRIATLLRPRKLDEIPTESGLCVDGGFIPMDAEFENIYMGVRLQRYPDIHFSTKLLKNGKFLASGSMLEERMRQVMEGATPTELAWLKRIKYMRRGDKTLGQWTGEEVLARLPAQPNKGESHEFRFASLGEVHNRYLPRIGLELFSGVKGNTRGKVKPSLNDSEMVLLWDTLLSSIRVRPTAAPAPKPEPKAPLGTSQATGRLCPQSGWWEADKSDGAAIEPRTFVTEGARMPHATVAQTPSTWQKLRGTPTTATRATVWTLVAYDPPPDQQH